MMPLMKWADTEAGSGLIVSADWSPGAELSTNSERDGCGAAAAAVTDTRMFVSATLDRSEAEGGRWGGWRGEAVRHS